MVQEGFEDWGAPGILMHTLGLQEAHKEDRGGMEEVEDVGGAGPESLG